MTTHATTPLHPALRRTSAALAVVGARQASQAFPTLAQSLMVLGLSVAAIAALAFG